MVWRGVVDVRLIDLMMLSGDRWLNSQSCEWLESTFVERSFFFFLYSETAKKGFFFKKK